MKRLLALSGSVLLGALGAVVLGSPAQAHHNTITAGASCADGKIRIVWTIENSEDDKAEQIIEMVKNPNTIIKKVSDNSEVKVGTTLAKDETLRAYQLVDADTSFARLWIKAKWPKTGHINEDEGTIDLRNENCGPAFTGTVSGIAQCDNETGEWKVRWTVTNEQPKHGAKVDILSGGSDTDPTGTKTGGVWTTLPNENAIVGIQDGQVIPAGESENARQRVAGTAEAARLKVRFTWTKNEQLTKEFTTSATVNFIGSCIKNHPKPDATFASDCTGIVTVTLTNAADATKDAKFIVYGFDGWVSTEQTVAPGGTQIVHVPAANSSSVVVKESGTQIKTYSWQDSTNCHPAKVTVSHTCAGVTVEVDNPAKGAAHTVKLVPSSGDTVTKTLQPGQKQSWTFEAPNDDDAFTVEVFIDDKTVQKVNWQRPSGCEPLDVVWEDTCTGLTITIDNPQDGSKADIVLTPTPGEPVSFTLNPGEKKTVEFAGGPEGLSVVGTANGQGGGEPLVWEKPEDCVPPQLPKTGDNTAGYIATGSGLVAMGVIVFFLARRRMVALRRMAS